MTGSPLDAALRVIEVLEGLQIPHVVVGSVASSLIGIPRATVDADLLIHLESAQIPAVVAALDADFYVSEFAACEAVQGGGMFNVIHLASGYKVDLHLAGQDPYEQTKLARRRTLALAGGRPLPVLTPEDVVLSKLRWYRSGGEQSQRQWADVLGVLRMHPEMERDYLDRWAEFLGVDDLLHQAQGQTES